MSRLALSILRDAIVSAAIYADDVRVWVSDDIVKPLPQRLPSALDRLSDRLCGVGLATTADKSCFILFPGLGRHSKPVTLFATGSPIQSI